MFMRGYGCNLTVTGCACNGPWYDGNGRRMFITPTGKQGEKAMKTKAQLGYEELITAGTASLAPNEFWCIHHADGPLEMTASKDLTAPMRMICDALEVEWDDLTEQGYRLGKIKMPRP